MLADGTKVVPPLELQIGWMLERWGVGVLGPTPDWILVNRATRALSIYHIFQKAGDAQGMKRMTADEWKTVGDLTALLMSED